MEGTQSFNKLLPCVVQAGEFETNFIASQVSNRLKEFVYGSMNDDMESLPAESWDFKIEPDTWELKIPQVLPMGILEQINSLD